MCEGVADGGKGRTDDDRTDEHPGRELAGDDRIGLETADGAEKHQSDREAHGVNAALDDRVEHDDRREEREPADCRNEPGEHDEEDQTRPECREGRNEESEREARGDLSWRVSRPDGGVEFRPYRGSIAPNPRSRHRDCSAFEEDELIGDATNIHRVALALNVDRDTAVALAVALLAVIALGAAAATLDSAVALGSSGDADGGLGSGSGDGIGVGSGSGPLFSGEFAGELPTICFPWLREPPALAGIGLLLVGLFAAIYRDCRSVFASSVVCAAAAVPIGMLWLLFAFCSPPFGSPEAEKNEVGFPIAPSDANETRFPLPGGGSGEPGVAAVTAPTAVALVLLTLALVGMAALAVASRGTDDSAANRSETTENSVPDVDAVARAAGTAADRIASDAAVDNEVYRAWATMTDALDLDDPETTTPAAFETAAVDAGMDPDDVAELRRLFEDVRYGGVDPTDDREARALSALRRIESNYGDES